MITDGRESNFVYKVHQLRFAYPTPLLFFILCGRRFYLRVSLLFAENNRVTNWTVCASIKRCFYNVRTE